MRPVVIAGVGQTRCGERWDCGLRELGQSAARKALADAEHPRVQAVVVGNMLAGELCSQSNVASLVADFSGLAGVEAVRVEAACGSGGAALRTGVLMIASGMHDCVLVLGVEKMTDRRASTTASALSSASDADYEALHGVSFAALNALLMRRYMHENRYTRADFAGFSLNAHANATTNPHAMFQSPIGADAFLRARVVAAPVHMLDCSPVCDGAAAVLLVSKDHVLAQRARAIDIVASAAATDTLSVATRADPLRLEAVVRSCKAAYDQAGLGPSGIDVFELHDAFTIMAALSLEAAGFADRGQGVRMANGEAIGLRGRIPISTFGGLKARGHPVGATGLYQAVEVALQLREEAAQNQVGRARVGMCQNIGGSGTAVFTHIFALR